MLKNKALSIIRKTRKDYNIISKEWNISRFVPSSWKIKYLKSLKKDCELLDLGCGNGLIVPNVLDKNAIYTGIDISEKLIKIAQKRFKNEIKEKRVKLLTGNISKLPFKKESFDSVVSFSVFHHIPSKAIRVKVLQEIKRVLKPGCRAIVTVWNLFEPWPFNRFKIKEQLIKPPQGMEKGDVLMAWKATPKKSIMRYLHAFTAPELKYLARQAGFLKIKAEFRNKKGEIEKNGEALTLILKK